MGKTSILSRFCDNESFANDHISTFGIDFKHKIYASKKGSHVKVKLWDTAGQERFKTLTETFYKKADGVLVTYSITDSNSFENIKLWMESIETHAS